MARGIRPNTRTTSVQQGSSTNSEAFKAKSYQTSAGAAEKRAGLEDQLATLQDRQSGLQGRAKQGGHTGRNARNQLKTLNPQVDTARSALAADKTPASDAQAFRHNKLLDSYNNAGGGHAGRNKRNRLKPQLEASQTKFEGLKSTEAASTAGAAASAAGAAGASAIQLDRFQKAGNMGAGQRLQNIGGQREAVAKDKIAKAGDSMDEGVQRALSDGEFRRSEQLELMAGGAEKAAAQSDLSAAKSLGKQGAALKEGARDGVLTKGERSEIAGHRSDRLDAQQNARELRGAAKGLRSEAELARNDELGADIAALKERREANLPGLKADYKNALSDYRSAVQEAGGYRAVRDMPRGPELDRIEGLRMKKEGAFQAIRASNKTGAMIRSAEEAMADGRVTTAEQAGIDKQVRQINGMYSESDDLKSLGTAVQNHANSSLAMKAIQSGDIKSLFTEPWGKEFIANAVQQSMMQQMGMPYGMDQQAGGLDAFGRGAGGRGVFDMQQNYGLQLFGPEMMLPFLFGSQDQSRFM